MITNVVDESNYINNHFEHQWPKHISQIDTNPTMSAFTLNANGLNEPIKRDCQTVSENTTHLPIYCLQDTHLKFKDVQMKSKWMEKIPC